MKDEIKPGDHVTIAGEVTAIENGCLLVTTKTGTAFWIEAKDIKTWRPMH